MATKIRSGKPALPDDELEILHPERTLVLGDLTITVREYGGVEWLRLLPQARPLIDELSALLEARSAPSYEAALAALAAHIDQCLPLVAQAADLTCEQLAALDPEQIEQLLLVWWGINGRFFLARSINRIAVQAVERQTRAASAGASSMPSSSPTATTSPISVDTPSAS